MRTISVDYRWIDSMDKCRDEIIKHIEEIENSPDKTIETPIIFTLNYASLGNSDNPQSQILANLVSHIQIPTEQVRNLSNLILSRNMTTNDIRPSIDDILRDEK